MSHGSTIEIPQPPIEVRTIAPETTRFLLLQANTDGSTTELLQDYEDRDTGVWSVRDRSDRPGDFTNPVYRGNHFKVYNPASLKDVQKLVDNPNVVLSDGRVYGLFNQIHDRTDAYEGVVRYLTQEPRRPHGMSQEEAELQKPTREERGPSIHDFEIKIDELEADRRTLKKPVADTTGRQPSDPDWSPTYEEIKHYDKPVNDSTGRSPSDPDWDPTYEKIKFDRDPQEDRDDPLPNLVRWTPDFRRVYPRDPEWETAYEPVTYQSVELLREYIVNRVHGNTPDHKAEAYMKKPRDGEDSFHHGESSFAEKVQGVFTTYVNTKLGDLKPWEMERWISQSNAEASKEVQETQSTGPDKILRLTLKYIPNHNGVYTDPMTGEVLSEKDAKIRNAIIHDLSHDISSYVQALAGYEFTKRPPEDYFKFAQQFLNNMTQELGYSDDKAISAIIGLAYSHKSFGNVLKNSSFEHPIIKEPVVEGKPEGRWRDKYEPVIKNGEFVYLDKNNKWIPASDITDLTGPNPYHTRTLEDGSVSHIPIKMKNQRSVDQDGNSKPVFEIDNNGDFVLGPVFDKKGNPVIDPDTGVQRIGRKILKEPVKVMQPVYDKTKIVIGAVDLRKWVTETARMGANQFGFEAAQMKDVVDKVIRIGRVLRKNYYTRGFVEASGATIDREKGRALNRRAHGRLSQEHAEMVAATSYLWVTFDHLLRNGPAPQSGQEKGGDAAAEQQAIATQMSIQEQLQVAALLKGQQAALLNGQQATNVFDPKMYAAGAWTNEYLPVAASLLNYYVNVLAPAAQKKNFGDHTDQRQDFK